MGEIIELYQDEQNNTETSWESEILNLVSAKYVTFTGYCSQDFDITLEWATTQDFNNIIDIDTTSALANNSKSLQIPVKAKYIKFKIENIASQPNRLITQGFFWK